MLRTATVLFVTLALCQCASKQQHQPIGFPAYFPVRPQGQFAPDYLFEMKLLEATPELTVLERKRLLDLYNLELKTLKPTSERFRVVSAAVYRLSMEVSAVEREVRELQEEIARYKDPSPTEDKPTAVFVHPPLKREYLSVYHLWNKDQNEAAMAKINLLLKNPQSKAGATIGEWMKLLNLRFRIAMDTADLAIADSAYQEMKAFDKCAPDSAQAGFLLALQYFSANEPKRALETFEGQCDPDTSPSNRIKRLYWLGRFREATGVGGVEAYGELLRNRVPGYYIYLAKTRTGQKLEFPQGAFGMPSFLTKELDVPAKVHDALLNAEERLKAHLRKDASVFLRKAAHYLRQDLTPANMEGLLYVAHLFEAAGDPLEAMKIYAVVTTELQDEKPASLQVQIDFLNEMFPRPHGPLVETLSRQWSVDPDFIYSIMRQESAFNPGAISGADARGLMQLMPALAKSLSHQWSYSTYYSDRQLFNAEENLKLAVYHLSQLQTLVPHMALIAASYNAGLARVTGWWKRNAGKPLDVFVELIPVNETRNYVKLVLRNYIHYKALRTGGVLDAGFIPFQLPPARVSTVASSTTRRS